MFTSKISYQEISPSNTNRDTLLLLDNCWMYYDCLEQKLFPIRVVNISNNKYLNYICAIKNEDCENTFDPCINHVGITWGIATCEMELVIPCHHKVIKELSPYCFDCGVSIYRIKPIFDPKYSYNSLGKRKIRKYKVVSVSSILGMSNSILGELCIVNTCNKNESTIIITPEAEAYSLPYNTAISSCKDHYIIVYKKYISTSRTKYYRPKPLKDKYAVYSLKNLETPIIAHHYDYLEFIDTNVLLAYKDDCFGYIDIEGNVIVPIGLQDSCDYEINKQSLSCGLLSVSKYDGNVNKYGFINGQGELIVPIEYDDYKGTFEDGMVKMLKGNRIIYVDAEGKVIKQEERYTNGICDNW